MRGNSTDFRFIFVVFSVSILLLAGLPGQDEVVERMDVVNREVVVRVFDGGEPVVGLIRADFTLTENGKPVVIIGPKYGSIFWKIFTVPATR